MQGVNNATTQLLTLLNVSALKSTLRKRVDTDEALPFVPGRKLNARNKINVVAQDAPTPDDDDKESISDPEDVEMDAIDDDGGIAGEELAADPYEAHFGPSPNVLTAQARDSVDSNQWQTSSKRVGRLGCVAKFLPEGAMDPSSSKQRDAILERLRTPFTERQKSTPSDHTQLQNDILSALVGGQDLHLTRTALESRQSAREAVTLYTLNHVTKKRRRILKNNERLTHHAKSNPSAAPLEDVQDQGFTRASVLILLPFRNSALGWVDALTSHTPAPEWQVKNRARFNRESDLPEGAVDKLKSAPPGTYPADHVSTFFGNVDDSFRIGVKITRKSVKLFADFYGCDIILASPLGLRMSIEKEKSGDFLSSIEVLVVDQMDTLTMQNWEHVQFVFSHLNQIPKDSHDADFSRIKPWYLDGHAAYLRQSVLLSAYETPETRSIFNKSLKNVAGKFRTQNTWRPLQVPDGINQQFVRVEYTNVKDELDKRFDAFTKTLLPTVLKSAVQSANTLVFVPSSFDFIRVNNHFRKRGDISFAALSEYSSNQDISRARQAFFNGKKAFLLISERFHFFRRYKLRGVRNVLFFGLPDHANFYSEILSFPFLDVGVEPSDVAVRVLWSSLDAMKLERIVGTEEAGAMIRA